MNTLKLSSWIRFLKAFVLFPVYIQKTLREAKSSLKLAESVLMETKRIALALDVDRFHGQYGQDILIDRILNSRTHGFFVELGAYDAISLSNTHFFETIRGWRGLLIEAQPGRKELLERFRPNSTVENCAISDVEREVTFTVAGAISGIEHTMTTQHSRRLQDTETQKISLKTVTLQSLFDKHGIQKVDYFSLDVEGGEIEVLKSVDFRKVLIDVITVEIDYPGRFPEILTLLQKNQFKLLGHIKDFKFTPLPIAHYYEAGDYVFKNNKIGPPSPPFTAQ